MKIAIIGAGFGGLSAAWELTKSGHQVEVFEVQSVPGGLAAGFQEPSWDWTLERHYHHVFTTDGEYRRLLCELGLQEKLFFTRVRTATRCQGKNTALDSPITLLQFSALSFMSRVRTGIGLAILKLMPFGKFFERFSAKELIETLMGAESWRVIWQPLFAGKFGKLAREINGAWFWARIYARSASLGYYRGGFMQCAQDIVQVLQKKKVVFHFNKAIHRLEKIETKSHKIAVFGQGWQSTFDQVLLTTDAKLTLQLLTPMIVQAAKGGVVQNFLKNALSLQGLGAQTLVLQLDQPFFSDGTYWLNINEKQWPFLAVVEQTQLTGIKPYGGGSIVYVAKYLSPQDQNFGESAVKILEQYLPYLKELSPEFDSHIVKSWIFAERFAQPVVRVNHSRKLPTITTPFTGVYWASMQHVYPFDRGINYAVGIGCVAARQIVKNSK